MKNKLMSPDTYKKFQFGLLCIMLIASLLANETILSGKSKFYSLQRQEELSIIQQPLPQTDCYGNHVEFSVIISGGTGPILYQWQYMPPNGYFTNIAGAQNANLSINNIGANGLNIDGSLYRVIITDALSTITSEPALLRINSITELIPRSANLTICNGGTIDYTVSTEGSVQVYQWEFGNGSRWDPLINDFNFSGVTTSRLTISHASSAQTGSYRVSVIFTTLNQPTDEQTCVEKSYTRIRNLLVRDIYVAPIITSNQQVCYNSNPNTLNATAVSGGSGPYSYQWQNSENGLVWSDITDAILSSYSYPALTATTYIRMTATDKGTPSCGTIYSNTIILESLLYPELNPIVSN